MTGTERLTAADSWFLYLEGPNQHLHVTGLMLLDPSSSPDELTFEKFRHYLLARLDHLPPLRQRLVEVPLGIDHPAVVEDPDLDVDDHLVHRSFDGQPEHHFRTFLDEFCSTPLDRSKPLWEMAWADGLADGGTALVAKLHHTMIDGITGVGIMADLLDLTADAPAERGEATKPAPSQPLGVPTTTETVLEAAADRISDPMRPLRAARRTGSSILRTADAFVTGRGAGEEHAAPFGAPRTRINASLTPRRAVAFGSTPLREVKELKRSFGVTVNDVVLASVATGLRGFLLEHHELPDEPLVAAVPVSVHNEGGDTSTNQVSNMFVHLPVQLDDPVERLKAVQRSASGAKSIQGAMGPEMLGDLVDLIPPVVLSFGMSAWTRAGIADRTPPAHTLIVSNVPGPDMPMYMAGGEVVGLYPFGPLMEGSGLNVTVLSHNGRLDVGLIACPDLVPGLDGLLADILDAFGELEAASAEHADAES
ncbi:MAG: wax ester/triacylglycerol synthase family O-acyltransferase [Actinomycetia bacterium]|nr:wax ester/triacylglycerol synthase family O-acyltransferase [Actinomycetes bacterium]